MGRVEWNAQHKSADEFLVLGTEHLMVCLGGYHVAMYGRFKMPKQRNSVTYNANGMHLVCHN